jgi:hypothetical protein
MPGRLPFLQARGVDIYTILAEGRCDEHTAPSTTQLPVRRLLIPCKPLFALTVSTTSTDSFLERVTL